MADQDDSSLTSTFPNPPTFWQDFTPENLSAAQELRKSFAEANPTRDVPIRLPDIPDYLINLQPPPEPKDGRWRVFGGHHSLEDKLLTLEEEGVTNLALTHPSRKGDNQTPSSLDRKDAAHADHALELKRLIKSLLLNYLELLGILSVNPGDALAKAADIKTLLINIHHALNEYRPHQARESAAELMQEHLDRTRRETTAIRSQVEKARRVLEGLGSLTISAEAAKGSSDDDGGEEGLRAERELEALDRRRDAELWAATDAAFA